MPEDIAEMDPDEFAEDLDPDIPDIKLRQKYLSINQRISDINVDPISEDPEQIDNNFNFNFDEEDNFQNDNGARLHSDMHDGSRLQDKKFQN